MNAEKHDPIDAGLQRMIRAHLWYGVAGALLGLLAALLAINFGPEYLQASPLFTAVAFTLVCAIGLSMAGGLMTFWSEPRSEPE